jgi:general nucleoside transport system ATP-binding protein
VVGEAMPTSSSAELASMMVGRPVLLTVDKGVAAPGESVLQVDSLRVVDERGQVVVDDVSFSVRSGEIYAIAGVQGNGQTELTESLIGLTRPSSGRILIDGDDVARESIDEILARGVGYVPEDRSHDGLVGGFTIAENLVLDIFDKAPFAKRMSLDLKVIDNHAQERVQEFDIRTSSIHANASTLSGGNQQKLVLARELSRPLKILVVAQPTRGVDVGSTEFVHKRIIEERDSGAAVVLISSELDEVLGLADRIAVMYRGRIVGEVPAGTSAEEIGLLMAGAGTESAHDGPATGSAQEAP